MSGWTLKHNKLMLTWFLPLIFLPQHYFYYEVKKKHSYPKPLSIPYIYALHRVRSNPTYTLCGTLCRQRWCIWNAARPLLVAWEPQCPMGVKLIRRRLTVRIQHGRRDGLSVGELFLNSEAVGLLRLKAEDRVRARVPPWLGVPSPCRSSSRTRSCLWWRCCAVTTPRDWAAKTAWVSPSCCGLSADWPRKVRANVTS